MIRTIQKIYNALFYSDKDLWVFIRRTTGYFPVTMHHYEIAFSHRSSTAEYSSSNERLELLGDSVINTIFSDHLYKKYPTKDEGFLTSLRSKMVNRNNLNKVGQRMQLDRFLVKKANGRLNRDDLYGNTLEAFVGAVYLDLGYEKTKLFLLNRMLKQYFNLDELEIEVDFKSEVFIYFQKKGQRIEFREEEIKKVNNRNYYVIDLYIDDEKVSTGEGFSKKVA
ncbi:MAG: ribonuclease III, partial [Chitinophagales bacterium]|nr:ribonuclease III [Chitinophagales bacterium]